MITAIANESFHAVEYNQLRWEPVTTAWPTGLVTGAYYSHLLQFPLQEILLEGQVFGKASLYDQTYPPDGWNHYYPNLQSQSDPDLAKVNCGESSHSTEIFLRGWPDQALDTVCGWGSSEQHTRRVRKEFAEILNTYQVETLNDAGCGDLAWMSTIDLRGIDYVGYDIYERANWAELRQRGYQLEILDITTNESRLADLFVCRDVFIHLPNDMILPALERFRRSASLLLTTSYTADPSTSEKKFSNFQRMKEPSLHHAKLDLTLPPFNLGHPLIRIPEDSPNKYLGLWDMTRLPNVP
ncbi:hypothetical protein PEBR_31865 [Penicillium brasilianum]|uniref:Methyltransferase domain-containing protein n=1 Tax=Penicillium brasilianum TaxID=104259 RepID=A0A1S9RFH5_PENBI|nr:hypothetical protein PEBR_31865 [Penicillium brasilianum]